MHRYEIAVLKALEAKRSLGLNELIQNSGIGKDGTLWAIDNLAKLDALSVKKSIRQDASLTEEGKRYAQSSLPETKLIEKVSKSKVEIKNLGDAESRIGLQWAKAKQLVEIRNGALVLTQKGKNTLNDGIKEGELLKDLHKDPSLFDMFLMKYNVEITSLIKRRLIIVETRSDTEGISITSKGLDMLKGESEKSEEIVDSLSKKMVVNKEWKGKKFKKYDVMVQVEREFAAKEHPLRRIINEVKGVYVGMGFKEVSGPIVVPAFWTFDTLFMPQDHPAREMQDTFYLSNPEEIEIKSPGIIEGVKKSQEESWHSDWSEKTAMQGVLRTHMTSVSVRELYNLKKYGDFRLPLKLFSIGRTFRNENIDYKHLADFYQMDGMIIGKDLTLANLFDTLIRIYDALGINIRFKPTYFPFVEPGAEVQTFLKQKKEWFELCACGIFRREITGIARKNISVLAWGAGIERIPLARGDVGSITELYNQGIGWVRKSKVL